jgi:hypothetical protein
MARRKKLVPLSVEDVAGLAEASPYVQRLIEDAELRANLQKAVESTKKAYDRISSSKAPAKALLEDRKLQNEIRTALESLRDATVALAEAPTAARRKGRRLGRKLVLIGGAGGVALATSAPLRSKVLDLLFGAEEEFQYSPPAAPAEAPSDSPVSAV